MIILLGFGTSLFVFLVFFWFFSNADKAIKKQEAAVAHLKTLPLQNFTISSKDIETIAGDDVLNAQLNLARAYIETERKNLAKSILSNVLVQGNHDQKNEAKRLIDTLQMVS